MLEVTIGATRRARCQPCGERMFGPLVTEVQDDVAVPQPSLPIDTVRRPDFVTPAALAKHRQFNDFRRRQSGESD